MNTLPKELTEIIVSFLDLSSRFSLSCVAKSYTSYRIVRRPDRLSSPVMRSAAIRDNMDMVLFDAIDHDYTILFKWLASHKKTFTRFYATNYCQRAAGRGNQQILDYIYEHHPNCLGRINIVNEAAKAGHLTVVKWLFERGCQWNKSICECAAESGNLELVKWVIDRIDGEQYIPDIMTLQYATTSEHFEVLKWLQQNGMPPEKLIFPCGFAAKDGRMDLIKLYRDIGCPWDIWMFSHAAEGGHLDILKWLKDQLDNDELTLATVDYATVCTHAQVHAASKGHLIVLEWLIDNGCLWDKRSCVVAARGGHLHILKWLKENGCPSDNERVSMAAAEGGHLEILEWMKQSSKENGCGIHDMDNKITACIKAASGGHLDILKWLEQEGALVLDSPAITYAAQNGHFDVVKWLYDVGCSSGSLWNDLTCSYAAISGNFEILEWLIEKFREKGDYWGKDVCLGAASSGHIEILKWLIKTFDRDECPLDMNCINSADTSGHTDILEWLHEKEQRYDVTCDKTCSYCRSQVL